MVAQAHLLVVFIHKHQLRFMAGHLVFVHLRERRNDQQVTHAGAACGRNVDRNHVRATLAFDGVGDEAFAVVDVPDVDVFVLTNVGGVEQVFIDCAGAFIMQFAMTTSSRNRSVRTRCVLRTRISALSVDKFGAFAPRIGSWQGRTQKI